MHVLQLAATLAHSRNQAGEASTWDGKVAKKQEELLETPMLEEAKARTKLDKHLSKVLLGPITNMQPLHTCGMEFLMMFVAPASTQPCLMNCSAGLMAQQPMTVAARSRCDSQFSGQKAGSVDCQGCGGAACGCSVGLWLLAVC